MGICQLVLMDIDATYRNVGGILGICQLVLMDIDATYRNVGGIFYANKQSILKKKNS